MENFDDEAIVKGLSIATEGDVDFLFDLGVSYLQIDNLKMAILVFDKIIQINPKYIDAWSAKGYALVDLGRHEEAIECFTSVTKITKNDADAWSDKGASLGALKRYPEAMRCLNKSIRLNKINPNPHINLAIILIDLDRYDEAIKHCEKAINIDPIRFEAHFLKGEALYRLGKYEEAIKSYDKAIEIKPDNFDIILNKSLSLINIKRYKEAIECCDIALKLDSNGVGALVNKGIAFIGNKKYKKAIQYFDEAININPHFKKAWYNKAGALYNLKKYSDSIKCYDEVIKLDPNYPDAYANKGIVLATIHKYDEAKEELQKARTFYLNKNIKNDLEKADEVIKHILYSKEIINQLKPYDEQFLNSLDSKSLIELRGKIRSLINSMEVLINIYEEQVIMKDIWELIINKKLCFRILSEAVEFNFDNVHKLINIKCIFEKWGLDEYIIALNSIDSFIHYLQNFKNMESIPKNAERDMLLVLKNVHILDGKLTAEISSQFKGELFEPKLVDLIRKLELKNIPLDLSIKKDYIRICLIQLDFNLTKNFPYKLKDKELIKRKIMDALEIARRENANIVCLPELSISEEFIEDIKKYKDLVVIAGSYYRDNFNICPVIINNMVYSVYKINPSPYLENEIAGKGMIPGNDLKVFTAKDFRFTVLICLDYLKESNRFYMFSDKNEKYVNFIFNPSCNSDIGRFQRRANSDCENYHVDSFQINAKEYGGTCIIGVEHKNLINRLINEGYRKKDDVHYKIYEANGEMMIIIDVSTRGVEVPTPVGAEPRIKLHSGYLYEANSWQKKLDPWWDAS